MQTVILAGGKGTRMSLSDNKFLPLKPLVKIGHDPIIRHVMGIYEHFGYNQFIICMGPRHEEIVEWARNCLKSFDITIETPAGKETVRHKGRKEGRLLLLYTGEGTGSGARVLKAENHLGRVFMATNCDGLSDINLHELVAFHKRQNTLATHTAVRYPERFGTVKIGKDGRAWKFAEKKLELINAGFYVVEKKALEKISADSDDFSADFLKRLSLMGQLSSYLHRGFWQCMDIPKEMDDLIRSFNTGKAEWKFGAEYRAGNGK